MSEKVEAVESTNYVHKFYCDECGEKIMESIEYDDGWCKSPDYFDESIYIGENNTRYFYGRRCLCNRCKEHATNELIKKLLSIGFKEEKNE